jgi:very-short-patch-repair endonuclease
MPGMRAENATAGSVVASIAARQHGVVTSQQLYDAGMSHSAVSRWAQSGRLHRVHHGVYAVGHAGLSNEGWWMAAVLACGETAVLSHVSAAALWKLLPNSPGAIHVSIPSTSGREKRPGIRLHRCTSLAAGMATRRHGIPVTSPARTIADLESLVSPAKHRRAIRQAEVLGLRTGLERDAPTRSELEDIFLALCRRHRLPMPEVNVRIGTRIVDFLWREQRVVVETDGYRFHRGSQAFEDDHQRDLELRLLSYNPVRLSHQQVVHRPNEAIAVLTRSLNPPPPSVPNS